VVPFERGATERKSAGTRSGLGSLTQSRIQGTVSNSKNVGADGRSGLPGMAAADTEFIMRDLGPHSGKVIRATMSRCAAFHAERPKAPEHRVPLID